MKSAPVATDFYGFIGYMDYYLEGKDLYIKQISPVSDMCGTDIESFIIEKYNKVYNYCGNEYPLKIREELNRKSKEEAEKLKSIKLDFFAK